MNLQEEAQILLEDRVSKYGDPSESMPKIAAIWNILIGGREIQPGDVPLLMIVLKLVRQAKAPQKDNLLDICGYAEIAMELMNTDIITPAFDSIAPTMVGIAIGGIPGLGIMKEQLAAGSVTGSPG